MVKRNDNHYKAPLNEVTRWEIIRRSQKESPPRFDKKKFYRAKDFDNVDFQELFENNNFTWSSRVGDYIVTISFEGAFDILQWQLKPWRGKNRWKRITHKILVDALTKALDREDLYVNCTCPDFIYRFAYWATQSDCKYGAQQNRPPTVRNVKNNKGFVCKHILAVLYGKRWVPAAARCWLEFIQSNPELSEYYIWGEPRKRNRYTRVPDEETIVDTEDEFDTDDDIDDSDEEFDDEEFLD